MSLKVGGCMHTKFFSEDSVMLNTQLIKVNRYMCKIVCSKNNVIVEKF